MVRRKEKQFFEKLEEDYSEFIIRDDDVISSIPTGSYSLDVSTGIGGIPMGRCTEIYGPESTAKSTMALTISRNALSSGKKVLYVDSEQAIDLSRARVIIGEDVYNKDNFTLLKPNIMETALQICEDGINSKEFGVVILDSIGSLAPKKVMEDNLDDDNVALLARRMTIFLQRNVFGIQKNRVAFIGLNQIRDKIGSYIRSYNTPGGWDWRHVTSMRIELNQLGGKERKITQGGEDIGVNIRYVVTKNKVAPPFRSFYFPVIFSSGIDGIRDLVEFSSTIGVVTQSGPYYQFEGTSMSQGMVGAIDYLRENPETLDKIVNMCYTVTNSRNLSNGKEDNDEKDT